MAIWTRDVSVEYLNERSVDTLFQNLGIQITAIGDDSLTGTMPVDHRTRQPLGILHGGASVALAESLGSTAANCCCSMDSYCVGLEVNANHIKPAVSGLVTGVAKPVHVGKSTHVWEIKIYNNKEQLTCISRITMAVLDKKLRGI